MAAISCGSPSSPNGKSIDRLLQEAQAEGKLHIIRRKLKCLPKSSTRYDLRDTTDVGEFNKIITSMPDIELTRSLQFYENSSVFINLRHEMSKSI